MICSNSSNAVYDGRLAYVPALEDVLVWDIKKGEMLAMWHETGHRAEVTCIRRSPVKDTFAVGYADGSIRLWDASSGTVTVVFNGHRKSVTALAFDHSGAKLASGSQDTELIVWDIVAESGLYRLRGHRDQITCISFVPASLASSLPSTSTSDSSTFLLSTAKDTFLKLWDLTTQHCIQTQVAHRSEIWSMEIEQKDNKLLILTGSGDGDVKAWDLDSSVLRDGIIQGENGELSKPIQFAGSLPLSTKHRVAQISLHPSLPYLAIQSHDRSVEIFRVRTAAEALKKQARRKKRAKEKATKAPNKSRDVDVEMTDAQQDDQPGLVALEDLFTPYLIVRASGKIRSFCFPEISSASDTKSALIMTALASNALEVYSIPPPTKSKEQPEATRTFSLDLQGHRTDIRAVALSSDDQLIASASNGLLKIWNVQSTSCIRTFDCGYALCCTFLPGDRQVAVGLKSGEIMVFDLASSALVQSVKAHEGAVWSLHVRSDNVAMVSGSADKDVKFWEFERKTEEGSKFVGRVVTITHVRTLKMSEDVLSVRYSPDSKYLAVALLDSTVRVSTTVILPVLGMDISSDSKLIITCSADKNIKIWGLDFGDCHRSLFAHDESVMQVAFQRNTHYFWSVSKDKMLKYWDGDKFEQIQRLDGHHGEIWALAVSNDGKFVVTGSHDKSIRIWEETDEPLFLEEERERELEQLHDAALADSLNRPTQAIGALADDHDGTNQTNEAESGAVEKQTANTLMAGERIMEAIDVADVDRAANLEYEAQCQGLTDEQAARVPVPPRPPLLAALGVDGPQHVLNVVEKVPGPALFDALLVLPFSKVVSMLTCLDEWAKRDVSTALTSRILVFLLRTHHNQIVANRVLRTTLLALRNHLRGALKTHKDEIGYNLAALRIIRRRDESNRVAEFYENTIGNANGHGIQALPDEAAVRGLISTDGKKRKRVGVVA
ncbi:small nucleolar ribonucleoprotein complex subunit Dip2 [Ceratobasidium sp. AG-Ba]|nr:small nucleolar ribonucleoprotein complex subunit Dip2 [Ceratobasidium sp. AG-Ba]QRW01890.1 small nucleolar ribonucleoprotein complex subunit Dip2 [Ceratobasidium sp. AG-Ba]